MVNVQILTPEHPDWEKTTALVTLVYRKAYGARLSTFMPRIMKVSEDGGEFRAIVGLRDAGEEPLFLETYLDEPIEKAIAANKGKAVERRCVVEIGNLAESKPGDARLGIIACTMYLHTLGYRWVVFTAVPQLLNAFKRLGIEIEELALADPARLPQDQRERWGSYYDEHPMVCLGDIARGFISLTEFDNTWLRARDLAQKEQLARLG